MTPDVREMFDAARAVQPRAHAPYSTFSVGAVVRGSSGAIYASCNVENAAFPLGTCAEAGAISMMVSAGETRIVAVLTVADGAAVTTCCGGCRQRIREFAGDDVPIYACGPDGLRAVSTLGELLPRSFGPDVLEENRPR